MLNKKINLLAVLVCVILLGSSIPSSAQTAPPSPTLNNAAAGNRQVTLDWTQTATAAGYKVKYGTASGVYPNVIDAGNVISFIVNSLTNNTPYYFVVTAYNAGGESGPSNELSAQPFPMAAVYSSDLCNNGTSNASSCLQGCASIYSHTKAFDNIFNVWDGWVAAGVPTGWLQYTFSSPETITKYTINPRGAVAGNPRNWTFEAYDAANSQWVVLDTRVNQIWTFQVSNEYTANNANAYIQYRLNISANGGHNEVGLTEMEMMRLITPGAPSTITNLQAQSANASVRLTWSEPASNGSPITSYQVQYGPVNSGAFNSTYIDNNVPGATINGLANNTSYQFRVVAVNAISNSDPSNTVTGTPTNGTTVSGPITANTTWTLVPNPPNNNGSPYIITGDVTVNAGVTLIVEPGVEVKFAGNYELTVNGTLSAVGTSSQMIRFTSSQAPAPGDWKGITTHGTSSIAINHAVIEYAGKGLYVPSSSPLGQAPRIENSILRQNIAGIYFEPSTGPIILNNTITNNNLGIFAGCNSYTGCFPTINGNSISNNTTYNLETHNYATNASSVIINATTNWWGINNFTQIENGIYHFADDPNRARVNFVPWLDAPGGNPVYPPPTVPQLISAGSVYHGVQLTWNAASYATGYKIFYGTAPGIYTANIDVGNVLNYTVLGLTPNIPYYFVVAAYNPQNQGANSNELSATPNSTVLITDNTVTDRFIDPKRSQTTMTQYTLNVAATVTIEIYDRQNQALVRTLISNQPRSAGANFEVFDGKDDLAQNLDPAVYIYKITASDGIGGNGSYDPVFTAGPGTPLLNVNVNPSGNFSPFKGERLEVSYLLSEPALVSLGLQGEANFLSRQPRDAGNHTDHWDGRDANGSVAVNAVSQNVQAASERLPENFIVIHDETGLAVTLLTTDPYLIRPLYNESTKISYTLNEPADVTVTILTEGGSQILKTLELAVPKGAGTYFLTWDGKTVNGETIAEDGHFRVRVKAVDSSGHTVTRDGVIKVSF